MFAGRRHDMNHLPSFNELMLSIVDHTSPEPSLSKPSCEKSFENHSQPQKVFPIKALGQKINDQPLSLILQLPHQLSKLPSKVDQRDVSEKHILKNILTSQNEFSLNPTLPQMLFSASVPVASEIPSVHYLADCVTNIDNHGNTSQMAAKRRHICTLCGRHFTTLGHLARHSRIHTGERNHKCPFPRCTARFARQDNCSQHYRIHFKEKSKRHWGKKAI